MLFEATTSPSVTFSIGATRVPQLLVQFSGTFYILPHGEAIVKLYFEVIVLGDSRDW